MDIEKLIDDVIGREGGYSNHPADRGGPTRWGVTQEVARENGYRGDMRTYPRELAVEVYRKLYWIRPRFDAVDQVYPRVAAEMFDTGVNMGPPVAAGFLQRALNALNRNETDYPDIGVDHQIGPRTIQALKGFRAVRGAAGEAVLLKSLDALQAERYISLAEKRSANEAFLYGWLANRVGSL